jgi:hypothetical protein
MPQWKAFPDRFGLAPVNEWDDILGSKSNFYFLSDPPKIIPGVSSGIQEIPSIARKISNCPHMKDTDVDFHWIQPDI